MKENIAPTDESNTQMSSSISISSVVSNAAELLENARALTTMTSSGASGGGGEDDHEDIFDMAGEIVDAVQQIPEFRALQPAEQESVVGDLLAKMVERAPALGRFQESFPFLIRLVTRITTSIPLSVCLTVNTFSDVMKLLVCVMKDVEDVGRGKMDGETKKKMVLGVVTRLIRRIPMDVSVKTWVDFLSPVVLPVIIDHTIDVDKRNVWIHGAKTCWSMVFNWFKSHCACCSGSKCCGA